VSDQGSVQRDIGNGVVGLAGSPSSSMIITNRVEPRKLLNDDLVGVRRTVALTAGRNGRAVAEALGMEHPAWDMMAMFRDKHRQHRERQYGESNAT